MPISLPGFVTSLFGQNAEEQERDSMADIPNLGLEMTCDRDRQNGQQPIRDGGTARYGGSGNRQTRRSNTNGVTSQSKVNHTDATRDTATAKVKVVATSRSRETVAYPETEQRKSYNATETDQTNPANVHSSSRNGNAEPRSATRNDKAGRSGPQNTEAVWSTSSGNRTQGASMNGTGNRSDRTFPPEETKEDYLAKYKEMKKELEFHRSENRRLQEQNDIDRRLLDQRTEELNVAQSYLDAARSCSGKDLIDFVVGLNGELLQVAASIADRVGFPRFDGGRNAHREAALPSLSFVSQRVESTLGKEVISLLLRLDGHDEETQRSVLQNVLQATILHHLCAMIESWSSNDTSSRVLENVYTAISQNAPATTPTVAGRWRAITKAQSKYSHYAAMQERVQAQLIEAIIDVVHLAGGSIPYPDHHGREVYGGMGPLVTRAAQLDKTLVEVVDEDWRTYLPAPGGVFDMNFMCDTYASPSTSRTRSDPPAWASVLCATDLGLMKTSWVGSPGPNRRQQPQVMVKAKVVLRQTITDALRIQETSATDFR
ncbi:hypothetical protein V5O48_008368 [Marasmius crinis-equi]|uniref:Uncharacterized protein n=1 Tax=Marasmius crinis-equi TaxID=585013 RepID=A0ABR3FEA9_9AGAR